jgi:transposase
MSSILTLSNKQRYFIYRKDTDMRMSFDGLCGIVRDRLHMTLMQGDVFIFMNKRKTHLKLLLWEYSGFSLFYRRLEESTFEVPDFNLDQNSMEITAEQLSFMLKGISLKKLEHIRTYQRISPDC